MWQPTSRSFSFTWRPPETQCQCRVIGASKGSTCRARGVSRSLLSSCPSSSGGRAFRKWERPCRKRWVFRAQAVTLAFSGMISFFLFTPFTGRCENNENQNEGEGSAQDGKDWHWLPEASRCLLQMADQTQAHHSRRPLLWGKLSLFPITQNDPN